MTTNLINYRVTDGVDDVLAAQYNRVLDSTVRGELSNIESLTANKTLTDADFALQIFTPTAARDVTLPAIAAANHPFYIVNASASYTLTVKNAGGTTIGTVAVSSSGSFASDGVAWHSFGGGGVAKASYTDVATGTDDTKYVTAKAIKDSVNVPNVAPSTSGNVLTSNGSAWVSNPPANRNAIINGAGIVNQRVTAYTLVKDVYSWDVNQLCGPDRFEAMATGTAVSAGTFNNIATANCGITGYAFKFIAVTLTGSGVLNLRYRMEANDAIRFKNQTASFRCQVYQDTGGAINYTVYIRKPTTTADDFSAVTAISNSGAISVPSTTATSLPYLAIAMGDCSKGIEIEISIAAGAITTKNFEITEFQLELGSVATPFEFRTYAQELALCQRYCRLVTVGSGLAASTSSVQINLSHPGMRTQPSVVALTALAINDIATDFTQTSPNISIITNNAHGGRYTANSFSPTTMTAQRAFVVNAGGVILLSAEL